MIRCASVALASCAVTYSATHLCTPDELNQIRRELRTLRKPATYTTGDDASSFDKFKARLYAGAMIGPSVLFEAYIALRKLTEKPDKPAGGCK